MLFTVAGITDKTLRGLMTGLLHRPCSMNQASYDLSRLAPDRPNAPSGLAAALATLDQLVTGHIASADAFRQGLRRQV